jgi:hypothetical protein
VGVGLAIAPVLCLFVTTSLCVVRERRIGEVAVTFGGNGDTLVNGTPFRDAYPPSAPPYAATEP